MCELCLVQKEIESTGLRIFQEKSEGQSVRQANITQDRSTFQANITQDRSTFH